jgi:hypothetical protein
MSLPASLLQQLEQHPCFPGVYHGDPNVFICLDPTRPPQRGRVVSCSECYQKFGVIESLLPTGMDSHQLAQEVTRHIRAHRGYTLSIGGYHAKGPGFYVSAVYFSSCGVFLIDGARSRANGSDVDLLILALRHGVVQPFDPLLLDARHYRSRTVHVRCVPPPPPLRTVQDLLSWQGCQTHAATGFHPVTLAEFLPVSTAPAPARAATTSATSGNATAAAPQRKQGDICPVCKAVICVRPLLSGTYLGCLC